jgi:predicted Zn-dependent peptidase
MSGVARTEAPSGLRSRVRRVSGLPVVSIRVWLRGGCLAEPLPGVSHLAGRLLVEGTGRRGWDEIASAAEDRGMALQSFGGLEAHGLAIDALSHDWEQALAWAAELVAESRFPEERCDWLRRQTMAELDSLADQPDVRTSWSFLRQLYHPHPAGRPTLGERESLETVRAEHCRSFHARAFARGMIVTVAGDVEEETVARQVHALFGGAPTAAQGAVLAPPEPRGLPAKRQTVSLPPLDATRQAHLLLGHLTVPRRDPDFRALEVAGVILGASSGLAGRIPSRVRESEGLAYTAQAHAVAGAGLERGRLAVYVATSPERVERTCVVIEEELGRLVEEGITEDEMTSACTYLLRREAFLRETARQWAELMAESLFYQLPIDDTEAVRGEILSLARPDVESAIRRHLVPDEVRITVGLPG